jgi:HD-like signal output (HDOD) protein
MSIQAKAIIDRMQQLLPVPEVVFHIQNLLEDADSNTKELVSTIEMDPVIAAQVLKAANSPLFGFGGRIETVARAVFLLGYNRIRELVWSLAAIRAFDGDFIPADVLQRSWRHSIYVGAIARILGGKCRVENKERLFTAGLLHDIGRLVLYRLSPTMMANVDAELMATDKPRSSVETSKMGVSHEAIGGWLLKHWNLPDSFVNVSVFHHRAVMASDFKLDVAIVQLADSIARERGYSNLPADKCVAEESLWQAVGLSSKMTDSLVQIADEDFREMSGRLSLAAKTPA